MYAKRGHVCVLMWAAKQEREVTFRLPVLSSMLYESVHEAQLWMVFNANKKLVAAGDAWPKVLMSHLDYLDLAESNS